MISFWSGACMRNNCRRLALAAATSVSAPRRPCGDLGVDLFVHPARLARRNTGSERS